MQSSRANTRLDKGLCMGKILIVDNDINHRDECHKTFAAEGHTIVTLPFGEGALSAVDLSSFDLMLLDIHADGKTHFSLLEVIRGKAPRLPIIILTDATGDEIKKEAYDAGAIEIIAKKTPPKEIYNQVEKILKAKERIFGQTQDKKAVKILIVDDEEAIRDLFSEFFNRDGFKVFKAATGEEAVTLTQKERPNLVLLDLVLPGMDGVITLKKLLEIDPNLGVIMITGVHDPKIEAQVLELGAFHFAQKPVDLKELDKIVASRLRYFRKK